MPETELNPFMDGLKRSLEDFEENAQKLREQVEELEEDQIRRIAEKVDLEKSDVKVEDFRDFVRKPYLINPKSENAYEVVVPKFLDFQVGRLDRQVSNYNIFVVDKYTKWMTGVPEFLEDEIDLSTEQSFKVEDDLLKFNPERKEVVEGNTSIRRHVSNVESEKATIKAGHEFELVAELIERGELPFVPQPVDEEDMREPDMKDPDKTNNEFELKSFQREGYQRFLKNGHACFCWMTGAGKSFPALKALDSLKYDKDDMRKAIVVYGRATRDQWASYIETYAPRLEDEVDIVTYHSVDKLSGRGRYVLIVFDECHTLPADTFAKGATIPTKYRMGLTATPYREDRRSNYIFALTGTPIGLDWEKTLEIMDKEYHKVNIHIVGSKKEKIDRIKEILQSNPDKNALIFCDGLDFGDRISKETGLNFVSGRDTDQLEKIRADDRVIVSRIGDYGLSLENLQIALEADFLYGSRRQELSRSGRLFHGKGERHDIFFTQGEFNKHQKRLFSLIEKGFTLNFVDRQEEIEVPDKYKNRVDLNLGGEKAAEEPITTISEMSGVDVLKHDRVQELIRERMGDYNRVKNEDLKEALIAVATSDDGLTDSQVEDLFQKSSPAYRYFTPFKKIGLVVKEGNRWRLNIGNIRDVIEKHEETKERKKEIEEIKQELEV